MSHSHSSPTLSPSPSPSLLPSSSSFSFSSSPSVSLSSSFLKVASSHSDPSHEDRTKQIRRSYLSRSPSPSPSQTPSPSPAPPSLFEVGHSAGHSPSRLSLAKGEEDCEWHTIKPRGRSAIQITSTASLSNSINRDTTVPHSHQTSSLLPLKNSEASSSSSSSPPSLRHSSSHTAIFPQSTLSSAKNGRKGRGRRVVATSFEVKRNDDKVSVRESRLPPREVVLPGFFEKIPSKSSPSEGTPERSRESTPDSSPNKERERERGGDENAHSPPEAASHRSFSFTDHQSLSYNISFLLFPLSPPPLDSPRKSKPTTGL
jgi:hypothetical protein